MAGKYRLTARRAGVIPVLAAAGILAAGCASSGSSTSNGGGSGSGSGTTSGSAVTTGSVSGVGTVLVNSSGMTIYTTQKKSLALSCTGSCTSFWFPVTGSIPSSSSLPGKFTTVKRSDGTSQLAYNGMPLYTFKLDTSAGMAKGQMYTDHFGGTAFTWVAVTATGTAGGTGNPAPSPSSTGGSGGYGY